MVIAVEPNFEDSVKEFAPLFQPLKDLAKNWNIDIEKCLAGFVEWIRKVTEVERNSGGRFNFAEAARVVSGGAEVYGRKIDYVHQLVRGCFEQLNEKSKKKHEKDDENDENAQTNFPDIPDDPCDFVDLSKLRAANWKTIRLRNVDCKPPKLLPQIPMELAPLTAEEKINLPLYDSIHPTVLIGMRDDFKVNTAFNHDSGALLLDLISEKIMNDFTTEEVVAEITKTILSTRSSDDVSDEIERENDCMGGFNDPLGIGGDGCEINRETQGTQRVCQMENRDSTKLIPDEVMPVADSHAVELFDDDEFQCMDDVDNMQSDTEDDGIGSRPTDVENFVDVDAEEVDIFSEFKYRSMPHKVIRCFKSAGALLQKQKKKLVSLGLSPEPSFMDYFHNEVYRKGVKRSYLKFDLGFSDMPMLAASEFTEKERRRRLALRNILRRQEAAKNEEEAVTEDGVVEEQDDLNGNGFEDSDSEPELREVNEDDEENKFADAIDKEDMGSNFGNVMYADRDNDDSAVPAEEMSFTARLRHYLNLYWAEGEEMASKLDERVQKWDETVSPLLEEESERRPFDIHLYGTEILQKFSGLGQQKSFFDLVREVPDYEVSRYFLSSLMLANTYNVEISYNVDEIEETCERPGLGVTYRLKLLNSERLHEATEKSLQSQ